MLDVYITDRAGDDLDGIWQYTNKRYDRDAANAYLRGFNGVFALLAERPEIGAVVAGLKPMTRTFGYREHRIYYRVGSRQVEIVRIAHKAQNAALFFD